MEWDASKQDVLDFLTIISFAHRKLDKVREVWLSMLSHLRAKSPEKRPRAINSLGTRRSPRLAHDGIPKTSRIQELYDIGISH